MSVWRKARRRNQDGHNRLYERLTCLESAMPGKISYNDFKGLAQRVEDGRCLSRFILSGKSPDDK